MEGNTELCALQQQNLQFYRQLTYLQYAINTQIFTNYINILYRVGQSHKLNDIFSSFAQTLLQFHPQFQSSIGSILQQSSLGSQLFKLLKITLVKMDINTIQYDVNVPVFIYTYAIQSIIEEQSHNNNHNYNNNYHIYLQSLILYIRMQQVIAKIRKQQGRQIDTSMKDLLILKAQQYYNMLSQFNQQTSVYAYYIQAFKKYITKIKYIYREHNNHNNNNHNQYNTHIQHNNMSMMVIQQNDHNIPIPYLQLNKQQINGKYKVITKYMHSLMKEGWKNTENVDKAQLLCLLFVEEYKHIQANYKYDIYVYLLCIKAVRKVQDVEQQLKDVVQFKNPSLQSLNIMVSGVLSMNQLNKAYSIMKYLLKYYKDDIENKEYLKLTVLALIVESKKNRNNNNIHTIWEQVNKIPQVITYMNNVQCIDYLIAILMSALTQQLLPKQSGALWDQAQRKQLVSMVRNFITKPIKSQESIEYDTKYDKLIQELICKRIDMYPHPPNCKLTGQTFSCKLIYILFRVLKTNKPQSQSLQIQLEMQSQKQPQWQLLNGCIGLLFQYGLSFKEKPSHDLLSPKILLLIMCRVLMRLQLCAQLLICYELLNRNNYDSAVKWIKTHKVIVNEQLWQCIHNYDLVQALLQTQSHNHNHHNHNYWKLAQKWTQSQDNYCNSTQIRKNKILHLKIIKFAKYLVNKFIENKQRK